MKLFFILTLFLTPFYVHSFEVEGGLGVGEGGLTWELGPKDRSISTLSELEWKALQYTLFSLKFSERLHEKSFLCFEGSYGEIFDGYNQDSDYSRDHKQGRYNFSRVSANKGELFTISGGLGYSLEVAALSLNPSIGWAHEEQHVRQMSPGISIYDANHDPYDPSPFIICQEIEGLHSNYRAKWKGPWVGIKLKKNWGLFHLNLGGEYHFLQYRGSGKWNLRQDLLGRFYHEGSGGGFKLNIEGVYDLKWGYSLGILANHTRYQLRRGVDRVRYPIYEQGVLKIVSAKVPLNEVQWNTFSLSFTLQKSF